MLNMHIVYPINFDYLRVIRVEFTLDVYRLHIISVLYVNNK